MAIALTPTSAYTTPQQPSGVERLIVVADHFMELAKNPPGQWKSIEATSGAIYLVDERSVRRGGRGAEIIVFKADHPPPYDARDLKTYSFDCQGHLTVNFGSYASTFMMGAVAIEIEAIACFR
jgi:hypothetical protein